MDQWVNIRMTHTVLTHWGRVTQICVSKFTIIGSDNGLSPIRRQAIIWTKAGILLIRTLGTNFSEIEIQIQTFSNKKMHLKMSPGKCRPFCLGLNVLMTSVMRFCANLSRKPLYRLRVTAYGSTELHLLRIVNTVSPKHSCQHFAGDVFKFILKGHFG